MTWRLFLFHNSKDLKCVVRRPSSIVLRPSSVCPSSVVHHLHLLSSHVSTLVHRISTFYCTYDSAGLQDEAMVTPLPAFHGGSSHFFGIGIYPIPDTAGIGIFWSVL